jgi:putative pyruvate formate lyase activating enzyme
LRRGRWRARFSILLSPVRFGYPILSLITTHQLDSQGHFPLKAEEPKKAQEGEKNGKEIFSFSSRSSEFTMNASYLELLENGQLTERVQEAEALFTHCTCCGWECRLDRRVKVGICRTGVQARLASYGPHMGEEAPLRGWRGSGTIFFAGCNLRCQYCQNDDISQTRGGEEVTPQKLAAVMLELQRSGCHNINFVSPTHVIFSILAAVEIAARNGLTIPLVYNTGGYDTLEALRLLDGVIDIYMPDMKYASAQIGLKYSKVRNYPQLNRAAVKEMHRQVGDLQLDENGLARRGLLVRHLVLPHGLAGTEEIVGFLVAEISPNTYLNVMDQYHPAWLAKQYSRLSRRITTEEYRQAVELARQAGLARLDA